MKALMKALRAHGEQARVVLEPTSTYHQHMVDALMDAGANAGANAGIDFVLINPSKSKAFSRLQGRRVKTDEVDARLLMELGKSQNLMASTPPDRDQEGLKSLKRHLESLEKDRTALNNRLEAFSDSPWIARAVVTSVSAGSETWSERSRR